MASLSSSLRKGKADITTQINQIDQKLSKKEKGSFLYLVEVLAKEADPSKSLIALLGDLRHKYCHEKDDSIDILRIILDKAKLKKYADILCPPNQFRPPTLENYQYISEHECKLVAMRSCLINLVCSLTKDLLRTLLETLCLKSDSNPENYTCIYTLLRELEQRATISPGRLEFISEVLEEDDRFASVRHIIDSYQEQFCNEGQRHSSTGNS
ncbi:PREDICTED: uncharacterized protein LOC109590835 [Amphimedon queenslandica]|uniref:DED domain-containing protein n=2 Tax=Amphimedon queenslandica TaxID=400682 RepID=A0AAN0JYS7_AMPQE|nr:PREDICTED: uncharacterized protein LOC109590835 [Amphimedon queenslandica]|eukprot:XP_019862266.1 PREDICTED: uncharacterized protein LOC109590835 [Amphimedon queenslandica]